jgi:hypothetical protein
VFEVRGCGHLGTGLRGDRVHHGQQLPTPHAPQVRHYRQDCPPHWQFQLDCSGGQWQSGKSYRFLLFILVVHNEEMAKKYDQEFNNLWKLF